jgi:hypothetical protein
MKKAKQQPLTFFSEVRLMLSAAMTGALSKDSGF